MSLLEVNKLNIGFQGGDGLMNVVTDLSFDIEEGKAVALVGESGCGKSVTALSIMRLLICPPAHMEAESILFEGKDIQQIPERHMWKLRGNDISMIFQEPMTSLNPVTTIGKQLTETIRQHTGCSKKEALAKAEDMLREVGIPEPKQRLREYPHQMSGGMRQRVMIAMALSCDPKLLIADEPTTALDVTIQDQILELIADACRRRKMALLLITHNMGIVAEAADEVMVMYAGQIVEKASVQEIFDTPMHPYTNGMLRAIPGTAHTGEEFYVIRGRVPSPLFFSKACRFAPRCDHACERCHKEAPQLQDIGGGHYIRCWNPIKGGNANE
ncbi:MAG: ABC transporter ATP-binding protein [Oscillospiraceae bacterium]|nr:ABC transporter ATP-binding protein [Oscillospiraceae bacterium]